MESTHRRFNNLQLLKRVFLLGVLLAFTGCSALISGYNSEFQCPNTNKGKCVSVKEAYRKSVEGTQDNPLVKEKAKVRGEDEKQCDNCNTPAEASEQGQAAQKKQQPQYSYREALFKKLSSMVDQPATPLVVPPDVMRVLILSYTGSDNELFTYRYVYFFATEPKWVISTAKEAQ